MSNFKKTRVPHNPLRFEEYIPYKGPEGEGFILARNTEYEEVYIFDDYGGWVDTDLNYYNRDCQPAGYFDEEFNFYDIRGVRVPGGYRGGDQVERRIVDIKRYIKKVQDNERSKFLIEFHHLPQSTRPDQILQFIQDRCQVLPSMIDECKKNPKEPQKAFIVVTGSALVYKILPLEGRNFRIKEKDGTYTSSTIELFVKLSKYNNVDKSNNSTMVVMEEDQNGNPLGYKIIFDGLDEKKSDEDFVSFLQNFADCRKDKISVSRQKNQGIIELSDEDLKFRILKMNGRKFGESCLSFKSLK